MCGMQVVVVACDDSGNVDLADLPRRPPSTRPTWPA
jgi:glycine cleavage system protein P-like pyridoxal-binding family